jgi:hypothetical protein
MVESGIIGSGDKKCRENNQQNNSLRGDEIMLTIEIKDGDKKVAELPALEKVFKTGSKGFFGMGKIQIGEKRYQAQVQLVEIGSKPKDGGEE